MGKRLASTTLLAAVTATLLSVAPGASALGSQESEFVSKINAERRARGKSALTVKGDLVSVARAHSSKMASKSKIWHNPDLPKQVKGWIRLGENVGMGPTVPRLHKAFMDSDGHRKNILGDYNQIGVGVVVKGGTIYVTEVFAKRASATKTASAPKKTTTTTRVRKASPAPQPVVSKPPPAPAPAPKPKPAAAAPRTVGKLLRIVGLDADEVDTATGTAAGF